MNPEPAEWAAPAERLSPPWSVAQWNIRCCSKINAAEIKWKQCKDSPVGKPSEHLKLKSISVGVGQRFFINFAEDPTAHKHNWGVSRRKMCLDGLLSSVNRLAWASYTATRSLCRSHLLLLVMPPFFHPLLKDDYRKLLQPRTVYILSSSYI